MHHMGRGDEKLCFCSNRSRTLVAMVAYSSHKELYIIGPQSVKTSLNDEVFKIYLLTYT